MSTGPINDWTTGLAEVGPIYPLTGAEGLWAGVALIFLIWWIMACVRMDQVKATESQDDFGDPDQMVKLLDALEGEDPGSEKQD